MEERKETMEDYAKELEDSFQKLYEGDLVEAVVVSVEEEGITVDCSYYKPGKITKTELSDDPDYVIAEKIHPGDRLTCMVLQESDGEGNVILSAKKAEQETAWEKLKQLQADKTPVTITIKEVVKGGAVAYLEGIRGFIPASRLTLHYVEDLTPFTGKQVLALVLEVKEKEKRLILSCRELLKEQEQQEKNKRLEQFSEGEILTGIVEKLEPYGAFVTLRDGVNGLLHISQISEKRVAHPKEVIKEGEEIKVKILKIKDGKISLSMKAAAEATQEAERGKEYKDKGQATTSLGSLLKNIKL